MPEIKKPAANSKDFTVKDSLGRSLRCSEPQSYDIFEIAGALGPVACRNAAQMQWATVACYVKFIDERPMNIPTDRDELKNVLNLVGTSGNEAVQGWLNENGPTSEEEKWEEVKN